MSNHLCLKKSRIQKISCFAYKATTRWWQRISNLAAYMDKSIRSLWAHGQEGLMRWWRPWRPMGQAVVALEIRERWFDAQRCITFIIIIIHVSLSLRKILYVYVLYFVNFFLISSWKVVNIKWLSISGKLKTLNFEKKVCLDVFTSLNKDLWNAHEEQRLTLPDRNLPSYVTWDISFPSATQRHQHWHS